MPFLKNMFAAQKSLAENSIINIAGVGAPISGIFSSNLNILPTGINVCGFGSKYTNVSTGVEYWNEGTAAAPYWTPVDLGHKALLSWFSDFRDGNGKAIADTAALATLLGSGLKVFGLGITEIDSGLVVAIGEDGAIATLTATNEDDKLAAIGVGLTTSVPFQPDSHGPLVIDVHFAVDAALTLRRVFAGFIGTAADALAPPVDGVTTTITLVQDDLAGLLMDAGLTAATRLFAPHNKSDEAATIATTSAGVDTGVNMPAAGTYVRLRVEISASGVMTCFKDKMQITQISAALDANEEVAPVFLVGSTTTATKAVLVKQFAAWGNRN